MNSDELKIKEPENAGGPDFRGYKAVCAKLGLSMCVYFVCRLLTGFAAARFLLMPEVLSPASAGVLYYISVILLVYIVPLVFTAIIFKYKPQFRVLYKKPRRIARALGTFPAAYGLGYGVILLTLLAAYVLYRTLGVETLLEDILKPTAISNTDSISELVMMVVLLVIAAPVFEEYWVRGVMFDALRPYGAGMAIIISSLLFGIMHGSLYMLFYTTALGFALGYIRYATGSLFTVTIIHAMINSVSAAALVLSSLADMTRGQYRVLNTIEMIFTISVLICAVAGIVVFLAKIPIIKKYKFENPWKETNPLKKLGTFFISIPVVIMLVLAFNEISGQYLIGLLLSSMERN